VPYHSSQYQALPPVYVQNSSLEIAWTRVLDDPGDIAGRRVVPFFTQGWEGFSIDYSEDLALAARAVERGQAQLPLIEQEALR
jgi:N-acylneuraminate cytidylyltransferase